MAENALVADVEPLVSPEDGIVFWDFAVDTKNAIDNEDWAEAGITGAAAGLDALAVVADPFGALLTSAFAWAMEHVDPLPEMLDALAGSPDVVQSNATTWANVSQELAEAATQMEQAVNADTAAWYGPAVDVYKPVALGEAKMIQAASSAASAVGGAVSAAGIAVSVVRTTVRDLIASAMSDLVQWLARSAVAAGLTLGLATPVLVADAIRIVAKWSTKVADWLQKIVTSIKKLAELVKKVKPVLDKVKDSMEPLQKAGKAMQRGATRTGLHDLSAGQQFARNAAVSSTTIDDQGYANTMSGES
ncbi:hypothetical protein [Parasphingorhabdus pacifica]